MRPGPAQILVAVPILLAAVAIGLRMESLHGNAMRDALALCRPAARHAWLVALLPAVTILFAQMLSPAGFTYDATLPAVATVAVVTEITFRGFAFLRLRQAGVRFLAAALIPGVIALTPHISDIRHHLDLLTIAGLLAQSVWLAWLVERWKSVWIAIVSTLLLTAGIDGFAMLTHETRTWLSLALRLWIIGMSVALTQTLQRRRPAPLP